MEQYLGPRLLKDQVSQGDYKQAVHNSFLDTASELKKANVDVRESGTTAVSCARRGNKLVVANVGDSRCVLGRFDGKNWDAVPLSRDHKPSDPLEKARIERVGGFVEPSRVRGWGFQGPARVWRRRQTVCTCPRCLYSRPLFFLISIPLHACTCCAAADGVSAGGRPCTVSVAWRHKP